MAKAAASSKHRVPLHVPGPDWVVAALATLGLADAAYLTWLKLAGGLALFCRAGTACDVVQASRYSTLLGLPIALWGAALYAVVGALALAGLSPARWRWAFLGAAAGTGLSAYLTYLSLVELRAPCIYCLASAGIMLALLGTLIWRRPRGAGRAGLGLAIRGVLAAAAAVVAVAFVFASQPPPATGYAADLARHIAAQGGVMYGAFWCPHCREQKELFGEAARELPYVECDAAGANGRPDECRRAGVRSFPTWDIRGERREGVLSLETLAMLSGFRPPGAPAPKP